MRKITRLLATVALLFGVVGGVSTIKAERTYASLSSSNWWAQAEWNSGNNTMTWSGVWAPPSGGNGTWYFIETGFANCDITGYNYFHATLANFSDNVDHIWLRIKQGDNNYADAKLVAGENNIDINALAVANPGVNFHNVTDITIWGAREALEGKTIDADNSASVVLTDVYMVKPDAPFITSTGSFGEEITSMADITDGTKFAIGDGTNAMYWISSSVDQQKADVKRVPSDSYCYYILEKVDGLDTDGDDVIETDNYRIKIVNASETAYPHPWGYGSYLNYSIWGGLWAASSALGQGADYGVDGKYFAIWKVAYSEGNGFTLLNVGATDRSDPPVKITRYAKVGGTSGDVTYLKFYKSIEYNNTTTYPANDEIFALANATGYDSETGILENGGWTFETPVDLSNWNYLIITVENTSRTTDTYIKITDNDGNYVQQNQYDPGNQPQMYFGTWNNHNAACISMDYLQNDKGLDISKIKSLSFSGQGLKISSVYLTNYENTKLGPSRGRYVKYVAGDVVRNYDAEGVGKFGTICLPYKASCAGAEVYSIVSGNASGITLTKVNGLLEAGKPYFYKASDETGNEEGVHNVNFFRADFDNYDVPTPVISNGLVGTFASMTAPTDSYVLSKNKLYKVNSSVTVGANKAYLDLSMIPTDNPSAARSIILSFDEATGIKTVDSQQSTVDSFYNLKGQRVSAPTKGLYIVNGKKVVIK